MTKAEPAKGAKKKAPAKHLSLYLPPELAKQLKIHAAETDRFINDLVAEFVREGLARAAKR